MEFTTKDKNFSVTSMLQLMDAVRVAFVDDQYNVLGIAKLNTSNRTSEDGKVKAPLYLYDFTISAEDDSLVMGERRKTSNVITALEQNTAKAISVVVWLDGDIVDNTMVSATEDVSLSGILNLQFASSADLIPSGNEELKNVTADKTQLAAALEAAKDTYVAGQNPVGGTDHFTSVSWNTFADAYTYADTVNQNFVATELQVYYANRDLVYAYQGLTQVSHEALQTKIDEIRALMGETDELACYVGYDKVYDTYYTFSSYTQEQYEDNVVEGLEIYRVDYNRNFMDSGDGVLSQIYTDESWSALAAALYNAEAVNAYDEVSDAHLDAALTALDTAYDALQRRVFFLPYDYNGALYYKAICDKDAEDTYGTWYDSGFRRIVDDLTILNLDAYAEEVEIAEVEIPTDVRYYEEYVNAYVELLDELYPELKGEEILALTWSAGSSDPALFAKGITSVHIAALNNLVAEAKALNAANYTVDAAAIADAEDLISGTDTDVTAEHAESVIAALQTSVDAANEEKKAKEEEEAAADTSMTDDQRTVLLAAVNAAKAVEGYVPPETNEPVEGETPEETAARAEREAKLDNLRTAVGLVETLLADPDATEENAELALTGINACLTALGEKEVTAYNTLVHTVPGADVFVPLYAAEHPGVTLIPTGYTGTDALTFTLLTRNGILINVERDVTVYYPSSSVDIYCLDNTYDIYGNPDIYGAYEGMRVGDTHTFIAELGEHWVDCFWIDYPYSRYYAINETARHVVEWERLSQKEDLYGDDYGLIDTDETIVSWSWSTTTPSRIKITNSEQSECVVTALARGSAGISVRVVTDKGNVHTYTRYFTGENAPFGGEDEWLKTKQSTEDVSDTSSVLLFLPQRSFKEAYTP